MTAVELAALEGGVEHIFADGTSTPRITVDLIDEAGTQLTTGSLDITVNNVAPVIALSGASEINTGASYTLNLGAITDPGDDTVTSYIVNWGDGSNNIYDTAGEVIHTFAADGNYTISVDLVDEDGTHTTGTLVVAVNPVTSRWRFHECRYRCSHRRQLLHSARSLSVMVKMPADGWLIV